MNTTKEFLSTLVMLGFKKANILKNSVYFVYTKNDMCIQIDRDSPRVIKLWINRVNLEEFSNYKDALEKIFKRLNL